MAAVSKWGDLAPRILSAIAMIAVGGAALWLGGFWFALLAILVSGGMIWEMARMLGAPRPEVMGLLAAGAMAVGQGSSLGFGTLSLAVVPLAGAFLVARGKWIFALYGLALAAAILWFLATRTEGIAALLWVVSIVVASDILGYFAGRILGGPKFWPRVSPKKTWSGTIAGWIGAGAVGAAFAAYGFEGLLGGGAALVILSVLVGFAGQMGDIAESAIKRFAGIKDSSNLIPGHGGLLDRFDALTGAAVFLFAVEALKNGGAL